MIYHHFPNLHKYKYAIIVWFRTPPPPHLSLPPSPLQARDNDDNYGRPLGMYEANN